MRYAALFKSPEHEERYLATYNAVLDLWSVPHETLDIETSFGTTHINSAGSPDLPPLVLLHGAAVNSTIWYPNVEPLSQYFRIYAPDIINQTGLSIEKRRPKTPQDCADWLGEVLDSLNIESAIFIGHSYGGWLTLTMAMNYPQRVQRMVLLAPAPAFSPAIESWQLMVRMMAAIFIPTKSMFYSLFQWMTTIPLNNNHILVEQIYTGVRCFRPQATTMAVMSIYKDDELRQTQTPMLLLIGEKEIVYKPKKALERAKGVLPHIQAELIADASHLLTIEKADIVNKKMLEFLK